jgi:hypothetical protein
MAIYKLMINKHTAICDGVYWNEISAHVHHSDKMMESAWYRGKQKTSSRKR